jgi:hypothetical protein
MRGPTAAYQHRAGPGQHGTEHEELAVCDVDDAHDSKHERQPEGDEGDHKSGDRALEQRQEEMGSETHK